MSQLRPIGTRFTEHSYTYNNDHEFGSMYVKQINQQCYKYEFEVVAHEKDSVGRDIEIIKSVGCVRY